MLKVSYIILDLGTEVTLDMIMSKNRMNKITNITTNDSNEQQQQQFTTNSNKAVGSVNVSNNNDNNAQERDLPKHTNANHDDISYSLIVS